MKLRLRLAVLPVLLLLALLGPQPAAAQETPPADGAAAEGEAPSAELRSLVEILRDDAARERLISELERAADPAAEPAEEPAAEPEAAPEEAAGDVSLGREIAQVTREAAMEVATIWQEFMSGLRATQRRLGGFARADTDAIVDILESIVVVVAVTIGGFLLLRAASLPIRGRIGRAAATAGLIKRSLLTIAAALLHFSVVLLSWGAAYAIALAFLDPVNEIALHQALYLNAYLAFGVAKTVLRTVFSPKAPELRMLPMGDATARYWSLRLSILAGTVIYGTMLVIPVVNETVSIFTGRATAVVIYVAAVLYAMYLVIRNRKAPAAHFSRRAAEAGGDVTLQTLAFASRFWHWAVIAYLTLLIVAATSEAGNLGPILIASAKIAAAIALGVFTTALIARASEHGVTLPGSVTERLPLIERRVNTFVPAFLRIVRFVILVVVVTFALNVTGVLDLDEWLRTSLGVDIASTLISVGFIVLVAFILWLAIASWVDWRLTPRPGRIVTSREQTLLSLLRNALTIAIIIVTLMFSLSEIGLDIAPLLASAGVLGLAIGFGAQKLVQDIITGVFIQFENAINVGDVVGVGGITGSVEKLTIRSVSLRDVQGVFHIIPFSSVDSVSNYMRGFGYHVADIGIAYRENTAEAKEVMLAAFEELRSDPERASGIIGDMEWFGVQSLGDNAVVLRARIKCRPGQQWAIGRAYNEIIKRRLDEAGIEIPFPQTTLWFGESKTGRPTEARLRIEGQAQPAAEPSG